MLEVVRKQSTLAYYERLRYKLRPGIQLDEFSSAFHGSVSLKKMETHVVRASLLLSGAAIKRFGEILSSVERERASRFHFAKERRRFIVCRGLLRLILGTYLGVDPGGLRFVNGPNGKPGLDMNEHAKGVMFSVSHSEELVLYAIARDVPVGVDVECVTRPANLDKIARRFFSSAEYGSYVSLPQEEKLEAFFRCWTRKEAFLKAIGEGWLYPLDRFDVSIGGSARLLSLDGDPGRAGEWSIHHLGPAEGYIGALAVRGKEGTVRRFSFDEFR